MEAILHRPVLVEQVVAAIAPRPRDLVVDATVGLGGHAVALLHSSPGFDLVGLDVDREALAVARERLAPFGERVRLVHGSYHELAKRLQELGIEAIDAALFDLGVSSLQLDSPERGFSFRADAPLDMRFSGAGESAADLLAQASEEELVRILQDYGEEPRARRVARNIVRARQRSPIRTTGELVRIIAPVLGHRRGRIDPVTRTFQALRIATNHELEGISPAIEGATRLLRPAGRLAVLAFHSLEDRLVKRSLRRLSGRCVCPPGTYPCACGKQALLEVLTRHPLRPDPREVAANPRARSARLRVAVRRGP
jgi:16S rRNA (cytosine1402-N4)-methyltransferase